MQISQNLPIGKNPKQGTAKLDLSVWQCCRDPAFTVPLDKGGVVTRENKCSPLILVCGEHFNTSTYRSDADPTLEIQICSLQDCEM